MVVSSDPIGFVRRSETAIPDRAPAIHDPTQSIPIRSLPIPECCRTIPGVSLAIPACGIAIHVARSALRDG